MKKIFDENGKHIGYIEDKSEDGGSPLGTIIGIAVIAAFCFLFYFFVKWFGATGYWISYVMILGGSAFLWFKHVIPDMMADSDSAFTGVLKCFFLSILALGFEAFILFMIGDIVTEDLLGYEMFIDKILG